MPETRLYQVGTFAAGNRLMPVETRTVQAQPDRPSAITKASLNRTLREAVADRLQPLTFMDLDWRIVNRQLDREALMRRSGPTAENILRDVGPIAAKVA